MIPMLAVAIPSASLGLWLLVTGRTFRGVPKWQLEGTSLRVVGAYDLLGSLFVIVIALAGGKGRLGQGRAEALQLRCVLVDLLIADLWY